MVKAGREAELKADLEERTGLHITGMEVGHINFLKDTAYIKIHYKSEQFSLLFGNLIGTKFERKCPDLIVDGRFYEYESYVRPWNKRKLANMLSDGLKQSDRIILDNRSGTSLRQILRAINARLNVNAQIAEVWVYDGDSILDIYP